jgi:hypothetical protein
LFIALLKWQEILEKFEFFPIKCRVQRALEIFKAWQEERKDDGVCFSTKVLELTARAAA